MPKTKPSKQTTKRGSRKRASNGANIDPKIEHEIRVDIKRDIDQSVKDAIAGVVEHFKRGRQVEEIMSKGMKADPVAYALGSLLVELSNEANINYTHPRIAGTFYRFAMDAARGVVNPGWPLRTCLRHIEILLNDPNAKTARKISKFWDDHESDIGTAPERDPFPERKTKKR